MERGVASSLLATQNDVEQLLYHLTAKSQMELGTRLAQLSTLRATRATKNFLEAAVDPVPFHQEAPSAGAERK
jgi:hypothetical protein